MSSTPNQEQDAQFAAEFNADVTREKLAAIYAEALCGACAAKAVPVDSVLEEFDSLCADILDRFPKFESILASAMVPEEEKRRIIEGTFQAASPTFLSFLKILVKRGRLDLIRDIHRQTRLLVDKIQGRVPVQITTAEKMDQDTLNALVAKLRSIVGGDPEITALVDPNTIGGIIVRVGDTVYDASIATQLKNVRQQMIDRSTHEIQSRRDRFRNTEGN
ncbi:MAG: ATP synthase F1 subunit delta [Planctomycetia bacterium]|nr:ATP synthase F1 subunit delta [Planctomycetia bacterium]